ncbi:MAG TPA: trypsin-like peptidase domain-containing protein [Dehalococcoidia bacterium]|nr:trypsin-like peptidase domain-containing protein [Dehalococcoidia bacterium]
MSELSPPPPGAPKSLPLSWLALCLAAAVISGLLSGGLVALVAVPEDGESDTADPHDAVARAVERSLPSVVAIVNELQPQAGQPGGVAGGAGFIIDERGYVLTNAHLVQLPGRLHVLLHDGQTRDATLVSHDAPFTDVAVIRIQGGGLRALPVGDSASLSPGETVIAIGSPDIDYMNSVTVGVVSATGRRKHVGQAWLEDLIQTDAAINVGNSGGPLLNLKGEVVGLNTFRDVGGGEDPLFGISFAISSRTFQPIARAIIEQGKYPRAYFGIDHVDLDAETAAQMGLRTAEGALVRQVYADSPAQRAGVRPGDVIVRMGRFPVNGQFSFINALGMLRPDERVTVQVVRGGQVVELSAQMVPR